MEGMNLSVDEEGVAWHEPRGRKPWRKQGVCKNHRQPKTTRPDLRIQEVREPPPCEQRISPVQDMTFQAGLLTQATPSE
jgi:hypothetical protein